jgi:hypothetical protein
MFDKLPNELVIFIFGFLDPASALVFSKVSKLTNQISKSSYGKAELLSNYYGKGQAFYYTYMNHRLILNGKLATILTNQYCPLPRFVAQLVIKDVLKS